MGVILRGAHKEGRHPSARKGGAEEWSTHGNLPLGGRTSVLFLMWESENRQAAIRCGLPFAPDFINASPAPSFVPRDAHLPCAPRNITHARGSLLQIAAFSQLPRCCEMLTGFGFRGKMYYLCNSKEERAHKHRAFSSFCAQKSVVLPRR